MLRCEWVAGWPAPWPADMARSRQSRSRVSSTVVNTGWISPALDHVDDDVRPAVLILLTAFTGTPAWSASRARGWVSTPGNLLKREDRLLDAEVRGMTSRGPPFASQRRPDHAARGDLGQRQAGGLGHEGHGARRAGSPPARRVCLGARAEVSPWMANCTFIRPLTLGARHQRVWRRSSSCSSGSNKGGSEQAESPSGRRPARCVHDAADHHAVPSVPRRCIDVDLDRVVEENGRAAPATLLTLTASRACSAPGPCRGRARSPSPGRRARSSAAPPAGSRSASASEPRGLFGARGAVGGWLEAQLVSSFWKRSRSSARSIMSGWCR